MSDVERARDRDALLTEFADRIRVACDQTRAVRGKDEVAVKTSDWHALMSVAHYARAVLSLARPAPDEAVVEWARLKALMERLRSAKPHCNIGSDLSAKDAHDAADALKALTRPAPDGEEVSRVIDELRNLRSNFEDRAHGYDRTIRVMADAERLLAKAPVSEDGWRPIETAPRDGTRFLAYEDGNHYALEWKQEMPGPDGGYWVCYCGQYVTMAPEPTHWRPLPALPTTEREDG